MQIFLLLLFISIIVAVITIIIYSSENRLQSTITKPALILSSDIRTRPVSTLISGTSTIKSTTTPAYAEPAPATPAPAEPAPSPVAPAPAPAAPAPSLAAPAPSPAAPAPSLAAPAPASAAPAPAAPAPSLAAPAPSPAAPAPAPAAPAPSLVAPAPSPAAPAPAPAAPAPSLVAPAPSLVAPAPSPAAPAPAAPAPSPAAPAPSPAAPAPSLVAPAPSPAAPVPSPAAPAPAISDLGVTTTTIVPTTTTIVPTTTARIIRIIGQQISVIDLLGWSTSLSSDGSIRAIGAYYNFGQTGITRVYRFLNNIWTKIGGDILGLTNNEWSGYSVSLSANGYRIAIGAPKATINNIIERGVTRIYNLSESNTWSRVGQDIIGETSGEWSGNCVRISQNGLKVAIGALKYSSNKGVTRVYELIGNTWTRIGDNIIGENNNEYSGCDISMSDNGSIIAIGAYGYLSGKGTTRIYQLGSNNIWTQIGNIPGETTYEWSGASISMSADGLRVAIGAWRYSNTRGITRVYQLSGKYWIKIGGDIVGETNFEKSGISISLTADGLKLAIGAIRTDNGVFSIYEFTGDLWNKLFERRTLEYSNNFSIKTSDDGYRLAYLSNSTTSFKGVTNVFDI